MLKIDYVLLFFCLWFHLPLATAEQKKQQVVFDTEDGGIIHAFYYEAGKRSVVLAHGAIFNKESWEELSKVLTDNGYSVLALDFRGYGLSKPGKKSTALYEDILAAIRYLTNKLQKKNISVIGASMGGGAAAKASMKAKKDEIEKLILLSPAAVSNPEQMQGKILFIVSKEEPMFHQISAQFEKAPEPKKLQIIEGSAHAQNIFKTMQKNALMRIILDFLSQ